MNTTLSSFGGIIPRMSEHSLGPTQATMAHDALLRDGRLEAWRERAHFADAVSGARSFHLHGCCVISWPDVVTAAELSPDWTRFYTTGVDGGGLKVVEITRGCHPTYYAAGVPAPLTPPKAEATCECSREADARSYVYTYVNRWGEESAPSPASNIVRVNDGTPVTVSGIATPPDGYGIVAANIYRATTGFRPADGKIQKPQTAFLYVTTIEFPSMSFVDTFPAVALGPAIETQYDRTPPIGMQGVVSIRDQIRLAGFRRNRVFFSEPFQPHNWPTKYDLTLDYHIRHMGELDQKLYVTTDAFPYIIDASSCDENRCSPVVSVETPLPDIGCRYANAAVMTPHGYIYASTMGIVLLGSNGTWHLLTAKWFGEREWQKLRPDTIRMAYWEGFLLFATDMATFLLNINGDPYGDMESAELVTLSDKPVACLVSNTGKLLLLEDDTVWAWDSADSLRPYHWRSRPLTGGPDAVGANRMASSTPARGVAWSPVSCKIGGGPVDMTLYNARGEAAYTRLIYDETPVRIPRIGRHLWYEVELRGDQPVTFLDLGTAHFTVNSGR